MTKASDNVFAKLIGAEGAAPSTPSASTSILYVKADGLWYSKDDAGAETLVSGGSGGLSNPMTTQGDVIYGGASGTPTRLGVGTAGQVLTVNAGATAPEWSAGGGASGGSITLVRTTSDVNNSTTTLADATGLSFFVTNGSVYAFRFFVHFVTAAITTGINLSINGPTASYNPWQQHIPEAAQNVTHSTRNSYDAGVATAGANIGAGTIATLDGLIAPTANGTLIIRFASEVGGSQATILTGSVGVLYTVS